MQDPRLDRYLELLLDLNSRLNLTAARSLEELKVRHLDDCLTLLELPEVCAARTILDLGTGGGLPGIPLAISLPDAQVTLLDATQKKIRAVQGLIEALELPNASTLAGRAEVLCLQPELQEHFDVVVARACASLSQLLTWASPFCKPGGIMVAFKGPRADEELQEATPVMARGGIHMIRRHPYQVRDQAFQLLVLSAPTLRPGAASQAKPRRARGSASREKH